MRFEYDFVRLPRQGDRFDPTSDQYQDVIRERAAEGWRLVTIYAPGDSFGTPSLMDLIFEKRQD